MTRSLVGAPSAPAAPAPSIRKLVTPGSPDQRYSGDAVAIDGDVAATELVAPDGHEYEEFGNAVEISGRTA